MTPGDRKTAVSAHMLHAKTRTKAAGALIALAAGDALGWPQERRASNASGAASARVAFRSWMRRAGGRFYPYEEEIGAGDYSDDTQMTFAVGRARLAGKDWWDCLTRRELPLLPLYERGAGRAVLQACKSWQKGVPPWCSADATVRKAYFNAGANGVAMRVMPHVLWHSTDSTTPEMLEDVFRDGIATHGHPRALVGAALYAFAARYLLGVSETLRFGELVEVLVSQAQIWASPPSISASPEWYKACEHHHGESLVYAWMATVRETIDLLAHARAGLGLGALSNDRNVLEALGALGKWNGSGTISAVAAIYLASQHAAQPHVGVLTAAFADGADTDTLAAMTGGLLGALGGSSWMPPEWLEVQDARALQTLAFRLIERGGPDGWEPLSESKVRALPKIFSLAGDHPLNLDKGLKAHVLKLADRSDRERPAARSWKVELSDGQTIYAKRPLSKDASSRKPEAPPAPRGTSKPHPVKLQSVVILARNFDSMKEFYVELLGLPMLDQTPNVANFGGLALYRSSPDHPNSAEHSSYTSIFVVSDDPDELAERLDEAGTRARRRPSEAAVVRTYVYYDPDGNEVTIAAKSKDKIS